MTDLPRRILEAAQLLIGAVHDDDAEAVARLIQPLPRTDLYAVTVALAAMVDDGQPLSHLLAWTNPRPCRGSREDVRMWRRSLTDEECKHYHAAAERGDGSPEAVDGNREYWKRRARRKARERRLEAAS